jgi:flagellar biogenesis protein FliO
MTMEWILVKTMLSLAAVLALMVGVVLALKKYVYRGTAAGGQTVPVEILGQRSLHPKRSILVVKVLDAIFVVGMSEQGLQTLGRIEDAESLAEIDAKLSVERPPARWLTWKHAGGDTKGFATFAGHLQESLKTVLRRQDTKASEGGAAIRPGAGARQTRRRP